MSGTPPDLTRAFLLRAYVALENALRDPRQDAEQRQAVEAWLEQLCPWRNLAAHSHQVIRTGDLPVEIAALLQRIEASSLGTDSAQSLRTSTGAEIVDAVLQRAHGDRQHRLVTTDREQQAADSMAAHGFATLVPYPGVSRPWLALCRNDHLVAVSYQRALGGASCPMCSRRRIDPAEAAAELTAAGLYPLEPYPGASKPWRSLCATCGTVCSPRLSNIRSGQGPCMLCARHRRRLDGPSVLYVLEHPGLNAATIGSVLASRHGERVAALRRRGWIWYAEFPFDRAEKAMKAEQMVLERLRRVEGVGSFLTPKDMPYGGWTGTVDARLVPPARLFRLITEARSHLEAA